MRWLDGIIDSMDMNLLNSRREERTAKPGVLQSMGSQKVRHNLTTEQQFNFKNENKTVREQKFKIKVNPK